MSPHIASMERRLVAGVIDAVLVVVAGVVVGTAVHSLIDDSDIAMLSVVLLFVAYHTAGLFNHDLAVGRVIAGITVVSVRAGGTLSRTQCISRPMLQIAWIASGLLVAGLLQQPMLIALPLLIDLGLLTFYPYRQVVADILCGTVVVNVPPLQPHRAPAGPMYSADDIEFGPKPRKDKTNRAVNTDAELVSFG